jgi:RHS repeat-associated protein
MKTIIYFLLFSTILCFGQGPSQTENYVRTKIYRVPTNNTIPSPTINQVLQNITYLDGFGKPIQKIINQFSSTGKNIVISHEYDALGRKIKNYLPYSTQNVGLEFESNALIDVENYPSYQGQNPYHELLYEDSSLSRVLKQASSGSDWAMGSGHEMRFEYKNNISGEVKIFKARAEWNPTLELYDISLVENGDSYYDVNSLYKQIEKNENWSSGLANTTESFYNKEGQIILKRSYENVTAYDTYYVYDQFGNLTYVIPPKADNLINNEVLDGLCFQYVYDYKNRLVEKKLPGKNWEYIVYDKLDRVVMTGPVNPPFVNLTNNGWMIYKYDTFNRPILQGWMTSTTINRNTRKNQQLARDLITSNFSEIRLTANNVTPAGTGNSNNPAYSYSNVSLPTTNYYVLSINYYDDYNYIDAPAIPQLVEGQQVYYNNIVKPKGLLTGRWVKMIQNSTTASSRRELSYTLYDEKARPVRNFVRNHQLGGGGFTQNDLKFDFEGKVERSISIHKRIESETPGVTVKDFFTYTDQGRLLTHTQQVNSNPIELITHNTYDELGKLIIKKVGNSISNPLQVIEYNYNVRGWLTEINDVNYLVQSGVPTDLFAYKINYNTVQNDLNAPIVDKQYNGNISETYWKTSTDNVLRKYAYKYDDLNRLKFAYYRLPNSNVPSIKSYDEGINYDKNGNIVYLKRNGNVEGMIPPVEIDELNYSYQNNSNRLVKITESTPTATSGFNDGANNLVEYDYDNYGNMNRDDNKGITNIKYNHLNLPVRITFGSIGTIEYIYNSDGVKLEKIVTQGTSVSTTKYLQGFQYLNDVLQFFPHSEGYVAKQGSSYKYVFQYKDHLGNVRLSYAKNPITGNTDVIEESHYYPFGLKHSGYNNYLLTSGNTEAQKYKYQGQERQDELGLNWDSFKWRNYDPALGRFMSIDPLAEKYSKWTPYAFAGNQVVHSRELEGLEPENDLGGDERENYNSENHGVGFGDAMTDHNHYQDAFPMGGELQEVVIGVNDFNRADESYGYDNGRYGEQEDFDNDSDGYSREDRANNERALEEMASNYQNIGSALTITGMVLTFTPLAPLGLALMASGSGLSIAGASISLIEDSFDGDDNFDTGKHLFDAASLVVPELYSKQFSNGIIGLDNLYLESIFTGSGLWMDAVSKP